MPDTKTIKSCSCGNCQCGPDGYMRDNCGRGKYISGQLCWEYCPYCGDKIPKRAED